MGQASVTDDARASIRRLLKPVAEQLGHDIGLVENALRGPDPEYALSLFVQIVREIPAALQQVEAGLASAGRAAKVQAGTVAVTAASVLMAAGA